MTLNYCNSLPCGSLGAIPGVYTRAASITNNILGQNLGAYLTGKTMVLEQFGNANMYNAYGLGGLSVGSSIWGNCAGNSLFCSSGSSVIDLAKANYINAYAKAINKQNSTTNALLGNPQTLGALATGVSSLFGAISGGLSNLA